MRSSSGTSRQRPAADHTGILKSVSGRTLKVYEGNHDNRFERVTRTWRDQITGFAEWWPFVKQQPSAVDRWSS